MFSVIGGSPYINLRANLYNMPEHALAVGVGFGRTVAAVSNKDVEFTIPVKDAGAQSYDLNYVVAYVNTAGTVTTGDVEAVATYSVEYN